AALLSTHAAPTSTNDKPTMSAGNRALRPRLVRTRFVRDMLPSAGKMPLREAVLFPAAQHQRFVLGCGGHRGRESLVVPLRVALEVPVARRIDQHAVPDSSAELIDVALLQRR